MKNGTVALGLVLSLLSVIIGAFLNEKYAFFSNLLVAFGGLFLIVFIIYSIVNLLKKESVSRSKLSMTKGVKIFLIGFSVISVGFFVLLYFVDTDPVSPPVNAYEKGTQEFAGFAWGEKGEPCTGLPKFVEGCQEFENQYMEFSSDRDVRKSWNEDLVNGNGIVYEWEGESISSDDDRRTNLIEYDSPMPIDNVLSVFYINKDKVNLHSCMLETCAIVEVYEINDVITFNSYKKLTIDTLNDWIEMRVDEDKVGYFKKEYLSNKPIE
jgi:drug/metabolite transporter superfamily protein YnfA